MDEFLESINKSASFLDKTLEHMNSALSSLEDGLLLNENESSVLSITENLSSICEDIDAEKTSIVDSADAIHDIVFDTEE